jgi:hypothetical protein
VYIRIFRRKLLIEAAIDSYFNFYFNFYNFFGRSTQRHATASSIVVLRYIVHYPLSVCAAPDPNIEHRTLRREALLYAGHRNGRSFTQVPARVCQLSSFRFGHFGFVPIAAPASLASPSSLPLLSCRSRVGVNPRDKKSGAIRELYLPPHRESGPD